MDRATQYSKSNISGTGPTERKCGFKGMCNIKPARRWDEAYPSGNGIMGVLAMGDPLHETLIFNHEKCFLPLPINASSVVPDMADILPEMRRLEMEGKYAQATDFWLGTVYRRGFPSEMIWTDPFHPAFEILIDMEQDGDIRNYQRQINFETGETTVHWQDNRGSFVRRLFVSRDCNVVVISLTSPSHSGLSCSIRIEHCPGPEHIKATSICSVDFPRESDKADSWLLFQSLYQVGDGGYGGIVRVHPVGGRAIRPKNDTVYLEDVDQALIMIRISPFVGEDSESAYKLEDLWDIHAEYGLLLDRHERLHREMFNRVRLELANGNGYSNEDLIAAAKNGEILPSFIERLHDFGRYLLISSSGHLPPNLQGVWNGIWNPPWSSDYTLDENLQMMMWQVLPGGLPELAKSYFNLIESYIEDWKTNARLFYGCRGVLSSIRSTTSGLHKHFSRDFPMMFWTAGAGWLAQMFYDYWLFTGDRDFLEKRAVPYMKEIALFYEDFLVEGSDGKYKFFPSYSPENTPLNSDNPVAINATMDIAVAKEVLTNLIRACEMLNIHLEHIPKWKGMLDKLPDYLINEEGAIKEWSWPGLEDDYHHRHSSHLYPIFPGFEVGMEETPDLYQACLRAAQLRLGDGIEAITGWGLAHLANISARLKDGELGYQALSRIMEKFLLPNLFTCHNEGELFQMDANLGFSAAILEMLVFSKPGYIELLPALPKQLGKGSISGVRCRGCIALIDLQWDVPEKQVSVILKSDMDQDIVLKLPFETESFEWTGAAGKVQPFIDNDRKLKLSMRRNINILIKIRIS